MAHAKTRAHAGLTCSQCSLKPQVWPAPVAAPRFPGGALCTSGPPSLPQVPELRLVCGDILRQDLGALLEGMRRHPAELAAAQAAAAAQRQLAAAGAGGAAASGEVAQHAAAASTAAGQQQPGEQQQAGQQQAEQARPAARRKVKVVANLPYYITKDCLLCMLPTGADIEAVYFMLQVGRLGGSAWASAAGGVPGGCRRPRCVVGEVQAAAHW